MNVAAHHPHGVDLIVAMVKAVMTVVLVTAVIAAAAGAATYVVSRALVALLSG